MSTPYRPLDLSKREFRVLYLLPAAQSGDDIHCRLQHAAFDNEDTTPEYEALSYVWGDPTATAPVTVDGIPLRVTVSIESALRRLRLADQPRVLWADAICINQQDSDEKPHQVSVMSHLYSNASEVLVWLGDLGPEFNLLTEWFAGERRPDTPASKLDLLNSCIVACQKLLDHPYWTRVWTFQEFVLARNTPVFIHHAGTFTPSLSECLFCFVSDKIVDIGNQTNHSVSISAPQKEVFLIFIQRLNSRDYDIPTRTTIRIGYALAQTAERFSCLPQDKIFALYGLFPQLQRVVPVDYSKSLARTTYDIMAVALDDPVERPHVHLALRRLLHPPAFGDESRLSWLPDLTYPTTATADLWRVYTIDERLRDAGIGPVPRLSQDTGELHLGAWNLGACQVLLEFDHAVEVIIDQILSIRGGCEVAQESALENTIISSQTASRFQWAAAEFCTMAPRILESLCSEKQETSRNLLHGIRRDLEKLAGQVAIVTDSGHAGICTEQVQSGDILLVSPVYDQALLMRKRLPGGCHYRIIGRCCVGGLDSSWDANEIVKGIVMG